MTDNEVGEITAETCVARVESEGPDGSSALLWELGDHELTAFTAVVDGKRDVVGLEVRPTTGAKRQRRARWSVEMAKRLAEPIRRPAPLPATIRAAIPVREILKANTDIAAFAAAAPAFSGIAVGHRGEGDWSGLSSEEVRRLDNLTDAVTYVNALRAGVSPARAIAKARTISLRTAEGRIFRARKMGLLTPAEGKTAGGELTPYAEDYLRRAQRVIDAREKADV